VTSLITAPLSYRSRESLTRPLQPLRFGTRKIGMRSSECENGAAVARCRGKTGTRESPSSLDPRLDGLVSGVLGRKTAPPHPRIGSQRVRAHAHACARAIRRSVRSRKPSIDEEGSQPSRYFLLRPSVNSSNRPSAFLLLAVKIASRAFARFSARDHPRRENSARLIAPVDTRVVPQR